MDADLWRKFSQKAYEFHCEGMSRDKIFDFLLEAGIPKNEIPTILNSNEERLRRKHDIKKIETDLWLPISAFFGGITLLIIGLFITFIKEGYVIFGVFNISCILFGAIFIIAGVITFFWKLKNKFTKEYEV